MRVFSCCLCGDRTEKEDSQKRNSTIQPVPSETQAQKEVTPAAQTSDDGGPPPDCTSTQLSAAEDEPPLQLAAGRLAKHLLERQPSKSKRSQRPSIGGAAGQRWVSNLDGSTIEAHAYNGSTAAAGLLLQEVKPLYDPVSGPSTSRLGGTYGSLTSQSNIPYNTGGGHQSSSMNFARSVNRLSAINTSGAFSRRASLLDVDFAKASLQLALGSSLLRGSVAGTMSAHGAQTEPWMLHNIFRQAAVPTQPVGGAVHSVPYLLTSGPLGQAGFAPSSLPATASVMAAIASGFGQNASIAGRQFSRENSRSSYSQIPAHSPAATHGQHALHTQHSAYPVPLFSRSVFERVEGLPVPLVVLVLRSAGAGALASDVGGGPSGPGPRINPHGDDGEQSDAGTRRAVFPGRNSIDAGYDCWPAAAPTGPVVTSMKLDVPKPQQIETKRRTSMASRHVSHRQQSHPSQTSHTGDGEAEARQRAYACLASALEEAAGRQVALMHAWHNGAAGALMSTAVSIAAATTASNPTTGGVGVGGSESQQSQCDTTDASTAAGPAAALAEGELGAVLWCLRELFDQDPCLPLLARDLLRQAAIRPEHVPPLTHSLVPSAYSSLLGGRDPFLAVTIATAAAAAPSAAVSTIPSGASGTRRGVLGASALQAAVSMGQVRVHVCVFQMAPPDTVASVVSTMDTTMSGGSTHVSAAQTAWLPAIVLEWPQPVASTPPVPVPVPTIPAGASSALNVTALFSPMVRGSAANSHRSVFYDAERPQSASIMTLEATGPPPTVPGPPPSGSVTSPRQISSDAPGLGNHLLQNVMPSLSLGMASLPSAAGGAAPAIESGSALAAAISCGYSGAGAAFGSPASAATMEEPTSAVGPELAPLAGADLLYVIQTWQRHHLLLASVPYAITLFDCGGRVLQQNQGSVDFIGEITGDPMEQHQSIAATAAAAAAGNGGLGTEQRSSATSVLKAGAEASGRGCSGSSSGVGAGGGFAGSMALMDISEVDVLSVLFCLCPDLLDEMLEEVICGNMWRGIVQVPRVMRPCIRAAQRWGAAGKAAVAQGSPVVSMAAAAVDAAVAGTRADFTGGGTASSRAAAGTGGPGGVPISCETPRLVNASKPMPLGSDVAAGVSASAGPAAIHQVLSSTQNSCSSSSNTMESAAVAKIGGINDLSSASLLHSRSFNSGRPSVNVASPLRRLATSFVVTNGAGELKRPGAFGGSSGGGDGNGANSNGGNWTGSQQLGPSRRPPARSYSLRGLMRPMANSFNPQYTNSSLRGAGAPHRLALGDGCSGGTLPQPTDQGLASPQMMEEEEEEEVQAAVLTPALPCTRRPPARVHERSSLGEAQFHSFTAGQSNSRLPPRHFSEQIFSATEQQQGLQADSSSTQGGQQIPKHAGPQSGSTVGAASKPRSSVLAFAERLRSGRLPAGSSSGGNSNSSSLSGTLPGARPAPRRLRSGLSLASGPDGPLPGLQSSPLATHMVLDSGLPGKEGECPEEEGAGTLLEVETDSKAAVMARASAAAEVQASMAMVGVEFAGPAAAPAAVQIRAKAGDSHGNNGAACAMTASTIDVSQMTWEAEGDGSGIKQAVSRSAKSVGTLEGLMARHRKQPMPAALHAVTVTPTSQDGGSGGDGTGLDGLSLPPVDPAGAGRYSPRVQVDQRHIRMMSDPVAHPAVLSEDTAIADSRNYDANSKEAGALAISLATTMCATTAPTRVSEDNSTSLTAAMEALMAANYHAGLPPSGTTPLGERQPSHSLPIGRLEAKATTGHAGGTEHAPGDLAERPAAASANGAGPLQGSGGSHVRGSVRRQLHALKRPLSRSSTRTYLMTAIPTSTLNVLGRVHSMRQMEYEERPGIGERDSVAEEEEEEEHRMGSGAALLRASTTNTGLVRRTRTNAVYRSKSHSLNVAAAEPRMAVPRIFSFMRSASKRMLQQMQGYQVHAAGGGSYGGDGCSTVQTRMSPQRRHTFELAPLDGSRDSGSGRGGMHRVSHSHRWSSDYPPPRPSPGLEQVHGCTYIGPSGSSAAHTSEATGGGCSTLSDGPLHNSSQEQGRPPLMSPSTAMAAAGAASSSLGYNVGVTTAAAAAATSPLPPTVAEERATAKLPSPPLPPQLSRLRASEDWGEASAGVRMMSPREMSPAEMARRVGMAWHEVAATSFTDPVTGARVVALVQNDVSEKVETEMQLTELMEVEHRLLEQIFPRHVLEHIAMQNISGTTVQHAQTGGVGRRQRRMSQFDLLKSQDCSQLAHHHDQITVLFCDVKGFTAMCSSVEPAVVMSFLNMLYTQFDSLLHVHDVYKVETIGDCYMIAGGLVRRGSDGVAALLEPGEVDPEHARKVVHFAKDLLEVVRIMRMPNGQPLQVRVGIHSGPAMSGVVGTKMPRFCLFGDTINTASRCESTCPPSSIHATTAVRDLVPEEPWVATGGVMAKGKGMMRTFLLGPSNPAATIPESADDDAVSDLCTSRPVGASMGSSFLSPAIPPAPAGMMAAMTLAHRTDHDVAIAPIAAAACGPAGPNPTAAASRHSALRRLGSGVRRNNSLRAITTTSAAVAAAAAAAAIGGAIDAPNSVPFVPPGSIAAAAIAAAGGGGGCGLGSSGPASPSGRLGSGPAVSSSPQQLPIATNSGYLRLPSAVLCSSPADTATTNTLVRTFAPAGELPYIATVMDPSRGVASAAAAAATASAVNTAAIDPEGDSLTSAPNMRVVNLMAAAGQRLGAEGSPMPCIRGAGVGMSPPPHAATSPHGAVTLFAAHTTIRTEIGTELMYSGAVMPASGLWFDSGVGVTATGPVLQAGALPPIMNDHEPQDLGENLRAPLGSRAGVGGSGSATASR